MAILTDSFDLLRTYAGSLTWSPLVRSSRGTVLGLLRRIVVGQIVVTDSDGAVTVCGALKVKDGTPSTQLRVLKETFWVRALLFADMVRVIPVLGKEGGSGYRGEEGIFWREHELSEFFRDSRRALCWVKSRAQIWLLSSRYVESPCAVGAQRALTGAGIHPQPRPAIECHDIDIFDRVNRHQSCPQH